MPKIKSQIKVCDFFKFCGVLRKLELCFVKGPWIQISYSTMPDTQFMGSDHPLKAVVS